MNLIACSAMSSNSENNEPKDDKEEDTVKLVYVEWASEIASTYVVKAAIEERLGYETEILPVSTIAMWESIATGDQDGMVAAWMPSLHENYYNEHKEHIENLGPNLEGAVMGLAVPDYVPIDSIEELEEYANEFDGKIIGIDPGSGIMEKTEDVLSGYNLDQFNLITGSDSTMTKTLKNAINDNRWIVVTGWTPHWKFAKWDLKYLQDPKNIYGSEEYISTMVRDNLQEDKPDVYRFLDNFYWEPSDMEQVMYWQEEDGLTPEEAAQRWIQENQDTVDQWFN
ncbi:glycine betaine/proline transport system substrate-binding protein [Oceanobacillus limi]|uniref:Glycine betaine/proline transport system substrate-binding protein n=1 Tax=Oceanobacillus limi TaxID=930131 RepID=A0A1I0CBY0_9BACI|nr:glycine betaine ABC transporter substrate-binding protein [Oceanobacillus limi]SET16634.1 glycine betaine/proline transport system substrate-binding protein [Oceanobacillus limi]